MIKDTIKKAIAEKVIKGDHVTESLRETIKEYGLYMQGTNPLTYMIDGATVEYPLVDKVKNYKNPRWRPMVLRPEVKEKALNQIFGV